MSELIYILELMGGSSTRGPNPLYRQLPHGPHGMKREEVAHHQRVRLYGAMIEAVARRGYAATTVAEVVALAGVSRRAFYEMFANKEDCFLATHDVIVARARRLVLRACAGESSWERRRHAGCRALLEDVARSPKALRLVVVESLGAGAIARERMLFADRTFERVASIAFGSGPDRPGLSRLLSEAIVAGVRQLLTTRVREGRERELLELADEVLDWCTSYDPAVLAGLPAVPRGRVPPEPLAAQFLLARDTRSRALTSIVHLTLDEGYAELSDPKLAQFAGISTESFHGVFADKQEAYVAALEATVGEALGWVKERVSGAASWPEAVHLGIGGFLDYAASHEALMRIAFVHVFEVGHGVAGRVGRPVEELMRLLAQGAPEPARAPLIAREAVTGALWGIVSTRALGARLARLPQLVDHLSFLVLAPYLGPQSAVAAIEATAEAPPNR